MNNKIKLRLFYKPKQKQTNDKLILRRKKLIKDISYKINKTTPNRKLDKAKFFNDLKITLNLYNINFGYQNTNSKKHGHLKVKKNLKTNEKIVELKIQKDETFAGQVYTIIHELTHFINDHIESNALTKKQAEVVADTVGIMFVKKYNLYDEYLKANISKKWDVTKYSENYINSMSFSDKKRNIILQQIDDTYEVLIKIF